MLRTYAQRNVRIHAKRPFSKYKSVAHVFAISWTLFYNYTKMVTSTNAPLFTSVVAVSDAMLLVTRDLAVRKRKGIKAGLSLIWLDGMCVDLSCPSGSHTLSCDCHGCSIYHHTQRVTMSFL